MNNYNLDNLLVLANNAVIPNISSMDETSNGTLSFGVVNSNSNGKRITISKALAAVLNLDNAVYLTFVPQEGVLILSSSKVSGTSVKVTLKGNKKTKRTGYNAVVVFALKKSFDLDYSNCVSLSFRDIAINNNNGISCAIINMRMPSKLSKDYEDDFESSSTPSKNDTDTHLVESAIVSDESNEDDFVFEDFEEDTSANGEEKSGDN